MLLYLFLSVVNSAASQVHFEELNESSLHPRTFYLSPNQEFQVISKVLCAGLPCPEYRVIKDYPFFIQQRSYRKFGFLRLTTPRSCKFKLTLEDGISAVTNYSKGANNRNQLYSKTLPLLIEVEQAGSKTTNPWCIMRYAANLYTPHFWGLMATPTEIQPEFESVPENFQVYVHTFSGEIEKVLLQEIELFRKYLDFLGLCYKKVKFYVAIYNVPHHPSDSRNELWFIKCTR